MTVLVHIPRRFTAHAWGGTEQVLAASLPFERAAGFAPQVLTTTALDDRPRDVIESAPIRRHRYFYPEWPLAAARRHHYDHKGGNLVSVDLARRMEHMPRLDLVHLHTGNRLGAQALRVARRRGAKVLITLHGGHFAIPDLERAHLAGDHLPDRGLEWGKILSAFWRTRRLLQDVDGVICVGMEEYEAARQALPQQKVWYLPGGFDPEPHSHANPQRGRQLIGSNGQRPLVVCVARLDAQKDQETLVKAWASLEQPCDLALVGPETSIGYADQCRMRQRMTCGQQPPGQLMIPGAVRPDEVADVLAAADIAVLPSRHEPFGLAAVEAWASHTPLIASKVGGPAQLLADGRSGLLFQPGNHHQLQAALEDLLGNRAKRNELAAHGRHRAMAEFTWAKRSQQLLHIYREVLGSHQEHQPLVLPTPPALALAS